MILFDIRVHRTGVDRFAWYRGHWRCVLQCHAALRTIARSITPDFGMHRTGIFGAHLDLLLLRSVADELHTTNRINGLALIYEQALSRIDLKLIAISGRRSPFGIHVNWKSISTWQGSN